MSDLLSQRHAITLLAQEGWKRTVGGKHAVKMVKPEIRELPGCFASGRTLTELREALGESLGFYLWDVPIKLSSQPLEVGEFKIAVSAPVGRGGSPIDA